MHQKYYELHSILYVIRINRSLLVAIFFRRPVYVTVCKIHELAA